MNAIQANPLEYFNQDQVGDAILGGALEMSEKNPILLFIQDGSPCIRNIKYAEALSKKGISIHLLFRGKDPYTNYGYSNSIYQSLTKFKYRISVMKTIRKLIAEHDISIIHYHNQPDVLCATMIKSKLNVPIVYDCHDFLSFKHHLSNKEKKAEKMCNENSAGVVYPSQSYLDAAKQYYKFTELQLVFGNYYPSAHLLSPDRFLPKLRAKDGKIHIVYQGRLSEKQSDHRCIVDQLRTFNPDKYIIHLYPSNNKKFLAYKAIPNIVLHEKQPYHRLITELSAYDFGLVMFNDTIIKKLSAIKYAFGNKTFDYLCAGLPVVVQDTLDEVSRFVVENKVGILLSQLDGLDINSSWDGFVRMVLDIRESYSMEHQINHLESFYSSVLSVFYGA